MITREKLEEFRSSRRELAEIRAEIKKAELDGSGTRNGYTIAMYEAIAAERADELERIEIEINHLESADHRRVLRMRYRADFSYRRGGELIVEDVKSAATRTRVKLNKRKMMEEK